MTPGRWPAVAQAGELTAADASHGWVLVTAATGSPEIAITDDRGEMA